MQNEQSIAPQTIQEALTLFDEQRRVWAAYSHNPNLGIDSISFLTDVPRARVELYLRDHIGEGMFVPFYQVYSEGT